MLRKVLHLLYQPYKFLILFPLMGILTILFGVIAVVASSLSNPRIGSFLGGSVWSRVMAALTPMFVSVKGKENITKSTSYIIVPNHQSMYDIFLTYGWLGLDVRFIMKKELAKVPGVGFGSKKVGHIFLDRSSQVSALKSLKAAKKTLVNGTSVLIFPEGTRSNTKEMLPFKRGAFKLAMDLGLPLLPVTINGTNKIMPAKSAINILPGKVNMIIHKPVEIKGYTEKDIPMLMEKVKEIIQSGRNQN